MRGFEERDPVILYQGALNVGRGLEQAIEAMHHVEGYELHLAGEGDVSDMLRSMVADQDLSEKVKFLGRVSPDDLPEMTGRARLALNLLEAGSKNYYFSLANKFFDYMHAGTPSINMDFPEYSTILGKHKVGMTVSSLSAQSLARVINDVLQHVDYWERMQRGCLKARNHFSWQVESKKLLDIFFQISEP